MASPLERPRFRLGVFEKEESPRRRSSSQRVTIPSGDYAVRSFLQCRAETNSSSTQLICANLRHSGGLILLLIQALRIYYPSTTSKNKWPRSCKLHTAARLCPRGQQ